MHDTDAAGILFFAKQFRFAQDALEDFAESEGYELHRVFHEEDFVFVVVHAEADYLAPLGVGDLLQVHLVIEKLGNSSITVGYKIYKTVPELTIVGTAKTVHVTLDSKTKNKIPIPQKFREKLQKHLMNADSKS